MTTLRRIVAVVCGVVVLSCMLACGSIKQAAGEAKRGNDMMQVGLAYHNFHDGKMKGPADANEFANFLQQSNASDPNASRLAGEIRSGTIVVMYGLKIPQDFPEGTVNTVLAYESKVPTSGGWVVMGDSSIRKMTPTDFNGAKKPQKAGDKKDK